MAINQTITISPRDGNKLEVDLLGINRTSFVVNLEKDVDEYIKESIHVLNEIIAKYDYEDEENHFYSDALVQQSLKDIARLNLFDRIFIGSNPDPNTKAKASLLKRLSEDIEITIYSGSMVFPWGLIYTGPRNPSTFHPTDFWGFKHILGDLPDGQEITYNTGRSDPFILSFNYNELSFPAKHIDTHNDYFDSLSGKINDFRKIPRKTENDLKNALIRPEIDEKIIYIYCHAIPDDNGDIDQAALILTDHINRLTLKDLKDYSPAHCPNLVEQPIILINACESLKMAPRFFNGFPRYFIDKGAAGVIGTFASVPSELAALFGMDVISRLIEQRETVGKAMRDSRRECLKAKNVLGICYMSYCHPGITIT